jgi:pimeloyl-ACP methyl ester carboxylesterase
MMNTSLVTIAENHNIYYQLINSDADKPYLVFLHEGLGCTDMWHDFPKLLCTTTGCPGLAYDRLGHGRSSPLRQPRTIHYLHEHGLQELPILLKKIIPEKKYFLIGHSDGGSISLIYGAERPPLLQGIITEAAHVFVDTETLEGIAAADILWKQGKLKNLHKYHGERTESVFQAWSATWQSLWFRNWNIKNLLPDIEVPLLVIQGADDQYGSVEQVNAIVVKSGGHARSELIAKCGHSPHREALTVVLQHMSEFITDVTTI